MNLIRRCLALILTFAVILSGAHSVVARSEMAGAVYPVLCSQAEPGAPAQAFDVTGRPIAAHHACPHCLAAGSFDLTLPPQPQGARWTLTATISPRTAAWAAPVLTGPYRRPAATGPPTWI
jgi:hypothetical protein